MVQLVLVRGLPGSGKTTLAEKEFPSHIHLEADMFMMKDGEYKFDPKLLNSAHRWCQTQTSAALKHGRSVIVTNTFTMDWEFDAYIGIVESLNVEDVLVIEMKTQYQNIHGVPEDKMEVMRKRWHAWGSFDVPEYFNYQEVLP